MLGHIDQAAARRLLLAGAIGLFVLCVFTAWIGPHSEANLEKKLQASVDQALASPDLSWATAEMQGQKAVLTGLAAGESARNRALEAALAAEGPGGVVQGGVTKVSVKGIEIVPPVSPFTWGAVKEADGVTLSGVAASRAARDAIEKSARDLYGDKVVNQMTLASGAMEGVDYVAVATQALTALRDLSPGAAELIDRRLTISGTAPTDDVVAEINRQARAFGGGVTAVADITGPPEWIARIASGKLTFTGRAPNLDMQRALFAAGKRATPSVEDSTTIAPAGGSTAWRARVIAALPHFAKFNTGEISVRRNTVRITGEAPGSVIGYLKEDVAKVRDSASVTYAIKEAAPAIAEITGVNLTGQGEEKQQACQTAFEKVMASNKILFGSNDASITRTSGAALDKVVEVARRCSEFHIEVQGHTDGTGVKARNQRLSQNRAEAVRAYMEKAGVPKSRLSSDGFGQSKPIANNRTESGRAQNRRIEFKVTEQR